MKILKKILSVFTAVSVLASLFVVPVAFATETFSASAEPISPQSGEVKLVFTTEPSEKMTKEDVAIYCANGGESVEISDVLCNGKEATLTFEEELDDVCEYIVVLPKDTKDNKGNIIDNNLIPFMTTKNEPKAVVESIIDDNCDTSGFYARNTTFTSAVAEDGAVKITNNKSNTTDCVVWYNDTETHTGIPMGNVTGMQTAEYVECSIDFKVPVQTYYGRFVFQFRNQTGVDNYRIVAVIRSDGAVMATYGGSYPSNTTDGYNLGKYKVGEWNNLRVVFHKKDGKIYLYLNDVEYTQAGGIRGVDAATPSTVDALTIRLASQTVDANTKTDMYLDNLLVKVGKVITDESGLKVQKVRLINDDGSEVLPLSEGDLLGNAQGARICFTEAINPATLEGNVTVTDGENNIPVTFGEFNENDNSVMVNFETVLSKDKNYTFAVSGVKNSEGIEAESYTTTFKTSPLGFLVADSTSFIGSDSSEVNAIDASLVGKTVYAKTNIINTTDSAAETLVSLENSIPSRGYCLITIVQTNLNIKLDYNFLNT